MIAATLQTNGPALLAAAEESQLAKLEHQIESAERQFVVKGQALQAIRDSGRPSQRLYRQEYATFEEYCRERWEMSDAQATRLIRSSQIIDHLKTLPIGSVLPSNEAQARELTRLELNEQVVEVWQQIVEETDGQRITTAGIRIAVDAVLGVEPHAELSDDDIIEEIRRLLDRRRPKYSGDDFNSRVRELLEPALEVESVNDSVESNTVPTGSNGVVSRQDGLERTVAQIEYRASVKTHDDLLGSMSLVQPGDISSIARLPNKTLKRIFSMSDRRARKRAIRKILKEAT